MDGSLIGLCIQGKATDQAQFGMPKVGHAPSNGPYISLNPNASEDYLHLPQLSVRVLKISPGADHTGSDFSSKAFWERIPVIAVQRNHPDMMPQPLPEMDPDFHSAFSSTFTVGDVVIKPPGKKKWAFFSLLSAFLILVSLGGGVFVIISALLAATEPDGQFVLNTGALVGAFGMSFLFAIGAALAGFRATGSPGIITRFFGWTGMAIGLGYISLIVVLYSFISG